MEKQERLTRWTIKNRAAVLNVDISQNFASVQRQLNEQYKKAIKKLATLEDMIEAGTLREVKKNENYRQRDESN